MRTKECEIFTVKVYMEEKKAKKINHGQISTRGWWRPLVLHNQIIYHIFLVGAYIFSTTFKICHSSHLGTALMNQSLD